MGVCPDRDGLITNHDQLIHDQVKRERQFIAIPVVNGLDAERDGGVGGQHVGGPWFDIGRVVDVTAISQRPKLVGEDPHGPRSLRFQGDGGRPERPAVNPEGIFRCRGNAERGTHTPDSTVFRNRTRGKEEALQDIAQTGLVLPLPSHVLLLNERDDGARDQIPILVQGERDQRLQVELR